jgi:type III secretion protein U
MAEKTHDPTPHRLDEARRRGEVVFSVDVASAAVFALVAGALWLGGPALFGALRGLWLQASAPDLLGHPERYLAQLLSHTMQVLLLVSVGVAGLAALAGALASFFQVGGLLAWERITPNLQRLNPAEGLQRVFSVNNLVNLAKMLLKTALLGAVVWVVIHGALPTALKLGHLAPGATLQVGARLLLTAFAWAGLVYLLLGAIDYLHVRHEFMKRLRMSIDELRQEHKDMEGDPVNRSRRRAAHQEAVYATLADRVKAASAVIHSRRVAVALQYLGEQDLPRVIARGEGERAAQIRRAAGEALVPMEFEPALAERLYDEVPEDRAVPRPLYGPVARLLRWAEGRD